MDQDDLLRLVCTALEDLEIKYFVTGSQATIAYGEPRFTNDIDIVVALDMAHLDGFIERFPEEEYYLSRPAAVDAISRRSMFNMIHPASGLKVDVIIPGNTPYDRSRFDRARRVRVGKDFSAIFSSAEDVILKKMEFFKLGESEKHLRDIAGVLKISGDSIDHDLIERLAKQFGVSDVWQSVLHRSAG
ncbi:MAG: hypothetical protein WD669_04485 [Pirellulales bacterium]